MKASFARIAALSDAYEEVRKTAAWALGVLGDPRAVEFLIAALADVDNDVRKEAAIALGALGDPRALPPLRAWVANPGFDVERTKKALAQLESRL